MGGALLEVWGILAFPTKREAQKHEFHLHKLYAPQRKVGEYFELGDTLANELAESMDRPPAPKPETKTLRPEVCLTKSEDIKSTPTISRSLALLAPKIPPTVSKTVFRQI